MDSQIQFSFVVSLESEELSMSYLSASKIESGIRGKWDREGMSRMREWGRELQEEGAGG